MRHIILKRTKQRPFNNKIYAFDVETYGKYNKFLCVSLYGEDIQKVYWDRQEFIDEILKQKYTDAFFVATNLQFDFNAIFYDLPEYERFRFLMRGSDFISVVGYVKDGSFQLNKELCRKRTFFDTMNYSKLSVEKIGKMINIEKLEKPKFLGKIPKDDLEKRYLEKYCLNDSKISYNYIRILFEGFHKLGATPKKTIASTSMSLFKNKYLKEDYFRHDIEVLRDILKSYYGGRTEVFSRGKVEDYNYYDVNSLYPSVMINDFPNPNSLRISHYDTDKYIMNYEGCSEVIMFCPYMKYPLLPKSIQGKTIFACGQIEGYYTHIEIRKALELGYKLLAVKKSYWYKKTCRPFDEYVKDLYALRQTYKKDDPNREIVKLLMNSLYGKFGQKFDNKDELIPESQITIKKMKEFKTIEKIGKFFRVTKDNLTPPAFCIPIWASYVTAYGRLKLYEYISKYNPVYCDTDSIITKENLNTSDILGDIKLELKIKEGYFIKPKFYAIYDGKNEIVKIKGLRKRLNMLEFFGVTTYYPVEFQRFTKTRECIRRGFAPNEIQDLHKDFSMEDNKRFWDKPFQLRGFQDSEPLTIKDNSLVYPDSRDLIMLKEKNSRKAMRELFVKIKLSDRTL